jgi:phosphoglycolate phosphatase-like HAD superfamily hydrolase
VSTEPRIIIFDFDGVVLESADIKTRAFALLFKEHSEEQVEAIVDLHLSLAGVSRYEKFKLIYRDILERPLDDSELERLGDEFSRIALEEVLACDFVPGARQFLQRRYRTQALYVASGTPEEELRRIVRERGLERFFTGVYGTPAVKGEIARRILDETGTEPHEAVFIGDALTDLEGAREAGTHFIGRRPADVRDPFEGESFPVVDDLEELGREWPRICARLHAGSPA